MASAQSESSGGWFNTDDGFRRSITLANPYNYSIRNYPFLISVAFPFSHLVDSFSELRLVDENQTEVPSYIVDEKSAGGFTTSALLLIAATLPPSGAETYELYYGDLSGSIPSYRLSHEAVSFSVAPLSHSVAPDPNARHHAAPMDI